MALTTISDVKTFLGITSSGFDAVLTALLASAEARINTICNRPRGFGEILAVEELFAGENSDRLVLTYTPIATITKIELVGYNGATVLIDPAGYTFNPDDGVVGFRSSFFGRVVYPGGYGINDNLPASGGRRAIPGFSDGFRNVKVTYNGGYSAITLPADLSQAAIEYTAGMFQYRQRDPGLQTETLGAYSYGMNPQGRQALEAYLIDTWLGPYIRRPIV